MVKSVVGLTGAVVFIAAGLATVAAPLSKPETGTVQFDPAGDERAGVVESYRIPAQSFKYQLDFRFALKQSGVDVYDLTFPSPVESSVPANNTVHAEYFVPQGKGPFPAVIVLDILDGQAVVARGEAVWLARNGVAALMVYMAHYGPRRPPNSKVRFLSKDLAQTMGSVRQTVLDCRFATAWLVARPEVDRERVGIVGTSLGSFISAITAAAEPKLKNVCLLLSGGGLVDAFYDHPLAKPYTQILDTFGGKEILKQLIAPADPITYASQLKAKNLLMVSASRDEVVPPKAAKALWAATGRQKIVWVDATHVGAQLYAFPTMKEVIEHVKSEPSPR